jgi:DNA-binding transcriptional MerR regulator
MSVATTPAPGTAQPSRLLTIGAVCRRLKAEFPDISISKIRYLEDQGLLAPRRTPGGYRLFGESDIDRLETILRLQRDEFLPLRVIKQELATSVQTSRRRQQTPLVAEEQEIGLAELCARAGVSQSFARDLEEYGLLSARTVRGERLFTETDAEVAAACARMASYGVSARHLRTFQTTADRAVALLGQITAPALHGRNPERRKDGVAELRALGDLSQELLQLLLWRGLRRLAAG